MQRPRYFLPIVANISWQTNDGKSLRIDSALFHSSNSKETNVSKKLVLSNVSEKLVKCFVSEKLVLGCLSFGSTSRSIVELFPAHILFPRSYFSNIYFRTFSTLTCLLATVKFGGIQHLSHKCPCKIEHVIFGHAQNCCTDLFSTKL